MAGRSLSVPVEVSECTTVTASYRARSRALRTSAGSTGTPQGTSRTSTASPRSRAQAAQRSEKAPDATARTRSGARFRQRGLPESGRGRGRGEDEPFRPKDLLQPGRDPRVELRERLAAVPDRLVGHGLPHRVAHPHRPGKKEAHLPRPPAGRIERRRHEGGDSTRAMPAGPRWNRGSRRRRRQEVPHGSGNRSGSARPGSRRRGRTRNRPPCPRRTTSGPLRTPDAAIRRRSIAGSGLAGVSASGPAIASNREAMPLASRIIREKGAGLFDASAIGARAHRSSASVSATPGSRCDFSTATCG